MPDMKRVPGSTWRVLAHAATGPFHVENQGVFDELAVDDWLHVEQMDECVWFLKVGDARLQVTIGEDGIAEVEVMRGFFGDTKGSTETLPPLKR